MDETPIWNCRIEPQEAVGKLFAELSLDRQICKLRLHRLALTMDPSQLSWIKKGTYVHGKVLRE